LKTVLLPQRRAKDREDAMNHCSAQLQDTLDKLAQCHETCLSMALTHCLEIGGAHARPQHLRLMLDCSSFCGLAEDAILRKSQFHASILSLCADICETCAGACEALGRMETCVAACRACMASCRVSARIDHGDVLATAERLPPG
jgi:hypothetical protein